MRSREDGGEEPGDTRMGGWEGQPGRREDGNVAEHQTWQRRQVNADSEKGLLSSRSSGLWVTVAGDVSDKYWGRSQSEVI